jgi:hypothetical protein
MVRAVGYIVPFLNTHCAADFLKGTLATTPTGLAMPSPQGILQM